MIIPETYFSVDEEIIIFGLSCLWGVAIGIFYDFLRVFRLVLPHNKWLVMFEDILFFMGYAMFLTAFASAEARGVLRFYYIAGNFIGATLYFFTLGSAVMNIFRKILYFVHFLFKPFEYIFTFLCKKASVEFVENNKIIVKYIKKIFLLLINLLFLLYNKRETLKGKNVNFFGKKDKKPTK